MVYLEAPVPDDALRYPLVPKEIKNQAKALLYTRPKDKGLSDKTPPDVARGVGSDCLGATGRLKFLWNRVVWDYTT